MEVPIPMQTVPLRTQAPAINVSALLEPASVDIEPTSDRIKCIGCDCETDKLTSQAVKLTIGYGQKQFESENLDNLGFPIMMIRSFPIMRDGRICQACFSKVERRADSQSHFRWYLGKRQVIFSFENNPGETRIPQTERYRTPNPTQTRKLDKGKTVPGTDIVLHVDQTPDFPEVETEVNEESFKKFGFSRGSRDYRKYIR